MFENLIEALQAEGIDMAWQDFANCRGADPDLFFPERGVSTRTARVSVGSVQSGANASSFAIVSSEEFGIWGALLGGGSVARFVRNARLPLKLGKLDEASVPGFIQIARRAAGAAALLAESRPVAALPARAKT